MKKYYWNVIRHHYADFKDIATPKELFVRQMRDSGFNYPTIILNLVFAVIEIIVVKFYMRNKFCIKN